ncbi:adenylate/guanylate cyclase domain-containing protein [Bradyrhizobium sp.]|uniref:adenylate/guanylate cyclase domain-containing protein n=1 Tax=Bradyrhizobium sp. TaxID=376 RepID=UPI001ED37BC0|nr:adenylate/guanylate cyclase domain-containing protein [Bradyrhizobium sp.]MBV9983048.1 AAA family ATPase [Bradyrhizobium sp.]
MSRAIEQWLRKLGLTQYAPAFAANDIDFDVVAQLTDADLKELGVNSLGHRKRLLAAIDELRSAPIRKPSGSADTAGGERRQVTILFADLCGFTTLSRSLDPEQLRELVAAFTAQVDGIVVGYGGSVDKHIGDAVMALFGAPRAHDDDPLRAARAALDIHAALARSAETSTRELQAHIGIASGEVVAGTLSRVDTHDYTVLGNSVNLAARLVALAGPGETLLSGDVYRALADRAACAALGETDVKGFDAPVRIWRLDGLANDSGSASRSAFVGRVAELEQFKAMLAATLARRSGQIVHVRGEAGIGKTRLVEEMRRLAEAAGFTAHRGLVLDFGVGRGQDAVRALLASMLGLAAISSVEARQQSIDELIAAKVVPAEHLAFLYDLLDLPQTAETRILYDAMDNAARNRGRRAVANAIAARACAERPTFTLVEDLHWADPQLLGLLTAFASALTEGPGLLILTSRVEGDPIDTVWRASCRGVPFATIDLGPLRRDEALSLAGSFMDATQRVAIACIERAAGNPLFLEQLLRNVEEGTADAVPPSIQSLVLARMDRLSSSDRQALQAAAVIGQRFSLALLRHLVDEPNYVCDGLISNALALPEGEDFLFAHALIQEGAYSSLLRSRRKQLHQRAAEWFEAQDLVLCAQHLDRAEDERAADAYLQAATAQRADYHIDAALRLAERGLQIARAEADRHSLICLRGELQRDLGDIASSIASYRSAMAASSDETALCRARLGLAEGLRVSEGLTEALELLAQAQAVAERHGMVSELARLHHLRGNIFFPLGKVDGCREEHERGLDYARRSGSAEAEARALGGLADAAYAQGKMKTACDYFGRCVALCQQHGFGRIEVANRSMVGFSRMYLNEIRQAREDGDAAARVAALVGQPRAELLGEIAGAFACYELAEYEAAKAYLARVMRIARQLGARRFEAQGLEMEARLLLHAGRRAEAESLLREALAICRDAGMQFCGPKVISALSRAVESPGERATLLAEGEAMLGRGSVGHNHLWFYRDAIEALLSARDAEGALAYVGRLQDYTRAEPLAWADLFAARGRALCAWLRKGACDPVRDELARIRTALASAGMTAFLPAIDIAMAT